MEAVMSFPPLATLQEVKAFLDPNNYNRSFDEEALRDASMFLRSQPTWAIREPLHRMGSRIRKHYYLFSGPGSDRQLLEWVDQTPELPLPTDKIAGLFKHVYMALKHVTCVYPISFIDYRSGALVIRDICAMGSLKDRIYNCSKPRNPFMLKYFADARGTELNDVTIRRYGRQLLEALKFLHLNNIPFGHLHSGNILLDGDVCKLTDIENGLLGVPSKHRPHLMLLRKISSLPMADVYSFGHVLYEMCTGFELYDHILPPDWKPLPSTSPQLKEIIESILSETACKNGTLPTVDQLIENPYFAEAPAASTLDRTLIKMRDSVKEAMRVACSNLDAKLVEEQKRASQYRRLEREAEKKQEEKVQEMSADPKVRKSLRRKKLAEATAANNGETVSFADQLSSSGSLSSIPSTSSSSSSRPASVSRQPSTVTAASAPAPVSRQASAASMPAAPPPPSGAPAPPPPPPAGMPAPQPARGALLSSITGFNKSGLSKTKTNDRSAPKV
ncbi:hypothetical protein CAOG_02145 [Capsaspora owczarzaki ATCC 30864]|nr:hypothetical protein CAOG_02145 [Capsaspora owczarzaki ATCC 30864]|eukprot:XP_004348895.2 hypothetical protein CAOG_02145 [Capsaspora owczarzaki ATCC 30864]